MLYINGAIGVLINPLRQPIWEVSKCRAAQYIDGLCALDSALVRMSSYRACRPYSL